MKLSLVILTLLLAGCTTVVPVTQKFPDIPASLEKSCPDLEQLGQDTEKLSEVLQVVVRNYGTYYECAELVEAWKSWHKSQKELFERVK
jgi:coenzyme F420-reducing hydrogenase alpha subunit